MKQRAFKWDEGVLGVMDATSYVKGERDALEEQQVDIEFAQAPKVPESVPQVLAEKKVAHKSAKKEDDQTASISSQDVERSNVANIASKFEEESREFDAQDNNMYITGEDGKLRLRHASDGYTANADKKKFEQENG